MYLRLLHVTKAAGARFAHDAYPVVKIVSRTFPLTNITGHLSRAETYAKDLWSLVFDCAKKYQLPLTASLRILTHCFSKSSWQRGAEPKSSYNFHVWGLLEQQQLRPKNAEIGEGLSYVRTFGSNSMLWLSKEHFVPAESMATD